MNSLETLREILGWSTAINFGILVFIAIVLVLFQKPIKKVHSGMFSLSSEDLTRAYFQYLAQYKIAVVVLNLVPYIAVCMAI